MLYNFNNRTLTNEKNIIYFQQWHKTAISTNQRTWEFLLSKLVDNPRMTYLSLMTIFVHSYFLHV